MYICGTNNYCSFAVIFKEITLLLMMTGSFRHFACWSCAFLGIQRRVHPPWADISSTETAGTIALYAFLGTELVHVLRSPPSTVQYLDHHTTDCLQSSYLLFPLHIPPRKLSDAGLLMFMLSSCQSGGELSGSGSVNWALIRCCSN